MKFINLNLLRRCKAKVAVFLMVITLFGDFSVLTVMAAENMPKNTVESGDVFDLPSTVSPLAEARTSYFINDSTFYFTGSNTGNIFDVPRQCEARLMASFVAMDDAREETITVEVWNTSGHKEKTLTFTTNKSAVQVFHIGSSDHYLRYYGRSGVRYYARVQLYTWDY